jgi:hypothetical protein
MSETGGNRSGDQQGKHGCDKDHAGITAPGAVNEKKEDQAEKGKSKNPSKSVTIFNNASQNFVNLSQARDGFDMLKKSYVCLLKKYFSAEACRQYAQDYEYDTQKMERPFAPGQALKGLSQFVWNIDQMGYSSDNALGGKEDAYSSFCRNSGS